MAHYSSLTVFLGALALTSCGGGSTAVDLAPTFSSGSTFAVAEGSTDVATIAASDPEGRAVRYSLVNGEDSALFSLSSQGQLRFLQVPDYETPLDLTADNRYSLGVTASDGGNSTALTLRVNVTDALEGRVVDGPLAGSLVFRDLDGDFELDTGEPQTSTDSDGFFLLDDSEVNCDQLNSCGLNVVAYGGTDTSTNTLLSDFVLAGQLQRNQDFIISPISTLLTGTDDALRLLSRLQLSVSPEQLALLDPWQLAENNQGSLLARNQQIGLLVQTLVNLLTSDSTATPLQVSLELVSVIGDLIEDRDLDLGDELLVTEVLNNTLLAFPSSIAIDGEAQAAVGAKLAMVNRALVDSQDNLTADFAVAVVRVAQTDLQRSVLDLNSNDISTEQFLQATSVELLFADVPENLDLANTDGDDLVDILDEDDDNDSVLDRVDWSPLDPREWVDSDGDDIGDNADPDDDNDGVADAADAFPVDVGESLDTDADGLGNNADSDDDNDSVLDIDDAFPLDATESRDQDGDLLGDNADNDDDNDSVADSDDAFPLDATEWVDTDGDDLGNNTDPDDDNDGVADGDDAFPLDGEEWLDSDNDDIGNNADPDDDNDTVVDTADPFPLDGTEWLDTDNDLLGDNADPDDDNDGVADGDDVFPLDSGEWLDSDGDKIGNNGDSDDDNDGVADVDDAFPLDPTETLDTDSDTIGNNSDPDDDNDSVLDGADAFPLDATEWLDTDGDELGNNADPDDDSDGVLDAGDAFPLDATESVDTDGDGTGNNADPDDDNDGIVDGADAFPLDATESLDTDGDEIGNNADPDDDNDSVLDGADAFPLDATESVDTDGDEIGNNADPDDDNDGVLDDADAFPLDASESVDTDGDEIGNNADPDNDNDGVLDGADAFPLDATESLDTDGDEIGNNADPDDDNDSVLDAADAFPLDATESVDTDGDEIGNNADPDDDNDGVLDNADAFPLDATESLDTDGDEIGNNADPDDDNDGVADGDDALPLDATESVDTDGDGVGNNADPDDDGDFYMDGNDAFPLDVTEWLDTDGDEIGNNADLDDDNDSVIDDDDAFPLDASESLDTDGDGIGNNADNDDDGDGVNDSRDDAPLDASITPPTALFYADQLQGSAPLVVLFDASDTVAGYLDDTVVSFSWDFADGLSGSGVSISHTFETAGTYAVVLTVLNTDGLSDTFTQSVMVSPGSYSVSGVITVADSAHIDSDVNDLASAVVNNSSFSRAQILDVPANVVGYVNTANYGANGKSFSAGDWRDYYQFEALGGEVINLILDSPGSTGAGYTDLDMYLYDADKDLVGYSISETQYESLMIPLEQGMYFLRVNVWSEGAGKYYLAIGAGLQSLGSGWSSDSEFAIGDVIVKERLSKSRRASNIALSTASPMAIRSMGNNGPKLYRYGQNIGQQSAGLTKGTRSASLTSPSDIDLRVATLLAAKELSLDPAVEYAEPNFLRRATQIPTDERYGTQWHYEKIRLPEAWDITTGSTDVKVAVLDTGIFVAHPDLEARLSDDGFDFINNSYNAGDGLEVNEDSNGNGLLDPGEDLDGDGYLDDGQEIDNDANDPGDGADNPYCTGGSGSSSFHGTHVAGTVGAETNNDDDSEDINDNGSLDFGEDIDSDDTLDVAGDGVGNGIAGVTWAGEIMNLRVLGCEGGYDFDIANAIRYAAGLENQSGIIVADPADIANMSLGGGGTSSTMSSAIADATEAGMIIIAAAGNSATELPSYPAAYSNVISVSATLEDDSLASYSNFGATVDVAAPGSKIKSTMAEFNAEEQKIKASYASSNGTSMAAPHVAGVVSLMKSVYPEMSPSDFDAILLSGEIIVDLGDVGRDDLFGAGRIDATKAVEFSKAIADGFEEIPVTPILYLDMSYLNYGKTIGQYSVNASNFGNGDLVISSVSAADAFVIISEPLQNNGISTYIIGIDRSGLADGIYSSSVSFTSNGGDVDVALVFQVMSSNLGSEGNLGNISVILKDINSGAEIPLQIQSAAAGQYSYNIDGVEQGVYEIHSGTDIDNDGIICGIAEACGAYPTLMSPATVIVNGNVENQDFSLEIDGSAYSE